MFKIAILLLCIITSNFAIQKNINLQYDVSYGIFGVLGQTNVKITIKNDNTYIINAIATTSGLVKKLSDNLIETYVSEGIYENKKFIPNKFKKIVTKKNTLKIFEYKFDHENKKITFLFNKKIKKYEKRKFSNIGKSLDYKWINTTDKKTLKYWSQEDILSLFFNLQYYIEDLNNQEIKSVVVIGSGESRQGKVDLYSPKGKYRKDLIDTMKQKKNVLMVKIYKNIFKNDSGKLYLSLDDKGVCNKTVLKDVLMYGDITAKLVRKY